MAKHVINQDQTANVAVTESNSEWIVAKGITLRGVTAMYNSDFDDVAFRIEGSIVTEGVGIMSTGIGSAGAADNTTVAIGAAGRILSQGGGLYIKGTGIEVENAGVIKSEALYGLYIYTGDAVIQNTGKIISTGDRAIYLNDSTGFLIENDGGIATTAGVDAVFAETSGDGRLVNGVHGLIDGILNFGDSGGDIIVVNKGRIYGFDSVPPTAVIFGTGDDHLINRGEIKGTISLGDGDDVADLRKGTLTNTIVFGNEGDDIFIVDDADAQIYESAGQGYDIVRTMTSFTLGGAADIEVLEAAGAKKMNLTGNIESNIINGNAAANKLSGGAGTDILWGLGGNDRLTGGADADLFYFGINSGKDAITDFALGQDEIRLVKIAGIEDFDDVLSRMTMVDVDGDGFQDDTIIDLGAGSTIRLVGVYKDMLVSGDFDISV